MTSILRRLTLLYMTKLIYAGTFYHIIKDKEGSAADVTRIHKEFFTCDRKASCNYVVKFEKEEKYQLFESEDEMASLTNVAVVWKKYKVQQIYSTCSEALMDNSDVGGIYKVQHSGMGAAVEVACERKGNVVISSLHHDSEAPVNVTGYEAAGSYRRTLTYTNALQDIIDFVDTSANCKQFTRIDCHNMVIIGPRGRYAFLKDRNHNVMNYIGGGPPLGSGCKCGIDGSCVMRATKCNCEANDAVWRYDEGYVTENARLPITEIRMGDTGGVKEYGVHTIGKLECEE